MLKALTIVGALVLVLHGLVHLLGTAAYMNLAEVDGLPYKTALLGGAWEVGESGMRLYGVLWAVAAVGFLAATVVWLLGLNGWPAMLVVVTLFSLGLTALDYNVAFMGIAINLAILAGVLLAPRLLPTYSTRRPAG